MSRILFHGGRVFDGTGSPTRPADVVVENGRVMDVGVALDGDEAIDVSGSTLLPGLFDCHTHVTLSHLDTMRRLTTPWSYRYYQAAENLRKTIGIGITTVREASGADLGIKQAVADGIIPGPRMQISIRMISQTGGHGDSSLPCGVSIAMPSYPGSPSAIVDGPDEMRRKVRELIREGADVIKVATSGGVLSPRDDPKHGHFRDDELEMLVAEATAAGKFVMAHAQATDGIKAAIRAGVRSVEHGIYLDDEAISLMLQHGTWLVPTLVAPRGVLDARDAGVPVPEWGVSKTLEVIDAHTASVRKAIEAGVKVAMGTDSGVAPHGQNLRELALMADLGMDAAAVLQATTSKAAALMGLQDELGTLEPGKRADVVVLDDDPYEFSKFAERVRAVWKDGERVI